MKIRLASDLQQDSIVDGEGIRAVIWTQGCPHKCLGCHNPQTHDLSAGIEVNLEQIYEAIDELEGQTGITFSGGDPFIQPEACSLIAEYALKKGYNIWCYTGYTFEQLLELSSINKYYLEFLKKIDVLVDGKFDINKKSFNVKFAGSSNQRVIDVKKSLKNNRVVLVEKYHQKGNESLIDENQLIGIYI